MLRRLWAGAGAVARVGAQSQYSAWCVRLKQYLQRRAFACPVNAMFHSVGSILAHTVPGAAAAICQKRRS